MSEYVFVHVCVCVCVAIAQNHQNDSKPHEDFVKEGIVTEIQQEQKRRKKIFFSALGPGKRPFRSLRHHRLSTVKRVLLPQNASLHVLL